MTNDTYFVHDVETNKIDIITMTADEQKELNNERKVATAKAKEELLQQEQKLAAKKAVLAKLGLTDEEAAALLA